jgi:hypothetical protein
MKEIKFFLNPPFFISMATAAKFVLSIPIFLAYLVPVGRISLVLIIVTPKRIIFGFLSSNFMKLCRNIHRSVWQLLGLTKFKMAAVAMVTKVLFCNSGCITSPHYFGTSVSMVMPF